MKPRALTIALSLALAGAAPLQAEPSSANPKPAKPAAMPARPAPAKPFVPMDPLAAIQKANASFNAATNMTGDFVQIGPDGRRSEGKIFVQRPGKLRFEYAAPATLEIVADGLSVAVHDRKTATKDIYFISSVPSDLRWPDVFKIGGLAVILAFVATLYPSYSASRVKPAEALRYE